MNRATSVGLALITSMVACGDDSTGLPGAQCTEATGTVAASVTGGTSAVFSWEPACSAALLLVEASGGDTWLIGTDDSTWTSPAQANRIDPPVTYGQTSLPAGVETDYGPEPLVAGTPYDLILFSVVDTTVTTCPDRFGNVCRLTIHEFTP